MNQQPTPITHHWVMTVQDADGRQGTNDGQIGAVPGIHTDESTFTTVLNGMKKWMGTENITVLFYRLAPNEISAPAVTR
jgi:hypothetical protein